LASFIAAQTAAPPVGIVKAPDEGLVEEPLATDAAYEFTPLNSVAWAIHWLVLVVVTVMLVAVPVADRHIHCSISPLPPEGLRALSFTNVPMVLMTLATSPAVFAVL
jgi:hypothetical protein